MTISVSTTAGKMTTWGQPYFVSGILIFRFSIRDSRFSIPDFTSIEYPASSISLSSGQSSPLKIRGFLSVPEFYFFKRQKMGGSPPWFFNRVNKKGRTERYRPFGGGWWSAFITIRSTKFGFRILTSFLQYIDVKQPKKLHDFSKSPENSVKKAILA